MKTINVKLHLDDDEIAVLKRYADETYTEALEITWRTVAAGWAQGGLRESIARVKERQREHDERMAAMEATK